MFIVLKYQRAAHIRTTRIRVSIKLILTFDKFAINALIEREMSLLLRGIYVPQSVETNTIKREPDFRACFSLGLLLFLFIRSFHIYKIYI